MKLHLCSGDRYLEGYENIDCKGILVSEDSIIKKLTLDNYYSGSKIGELKDFYIDKRFNLLGNNLPYKDNSIDEVVMISAIEHFSLRQAQNIVSEIYRVLRVRGKFLVDFPDIISTINLY